MWPRLRKPELLLLAGLFHDIAKGRGGDHSELGAVDAREFCDAHGLPSADTELVAWLVRKHLLMSVTAQKQDISDPEVDPSLRHAGRRPRAPRLSLPADLRRHRRHQPEAVERVEGPPARRPVHRHAPRAARGLEHPVAADERIAETARRRARDCCDAAASTRPTIDALFARDAGRRLPALPARADRLAGAASLRDAPPATRRCCVRAHRAARAARCEVFVHSPDRDGLFAAIVATLDRLGLAMHAGARARRPATARVFDTFQVLPADAPARRSPRRSRARLATALRDADSTRAARRAARQPRHLRHFRIAPQVEFGDAADGRRTLLSLVCTDRPGLLADVAQVLRAQRLRVHDARIATFGERAEDVFQITDERDQRAGRRAPATRCATRCCACLDGDPR